MHSTLVRSSVYDSMQRMQRGAMHTRMQEGSTARVRGVQAYAYITQRACAAALRSVVAL